MTRHLICALGTLAILLIAGQGTLSAQIAPVPETRFIPEKAIFGVVVRPSAILQNAEVQKLYQLSRAMPAMPERELGTEFSSLDLAVIGMTVPESLPGAEPSPTFLLRTKDAAAMKAITAKAIRPELIKKTLPGTTSEAYISPKPNVQMAGGMKMEMTKQAFEKMEAEATAAAAHPDAWKNSDTFVLPDDRTLLYGHHGVNLAAILNQIKPGAPAPAWAKQFDSPARFPVAAFVDLKQARELIKAMTGGAPPPGEAGMIFTMVSPLWEKADFAMLALDTGDGLKLTLVANSADAASAQALKGSLEGFIAMGKGFLPMVKAESSKLDMFKPGLGAQLYGDLEKAVSELSVTQNGTMTILKFAIQQQTLATITSTIVPLIEKSQEAARMNQGINNLKQIAISLHNYNDTFKTFPAPAKMKKAGNPPHSWRVAILPFIEEDALYKQYKFDEPWDSEANKKVLAQMPATYRAPGADPTSTNTSYVMPIVDKGIFSAETVLKGPSLSTVKDGLSNTIAVIETETTIPWTKPEDLVIDASKPLPPLGFAKNPTLNVAFADGAAYRFIKNPTIELLLPFLTASAGDMGDIGKLMANTAGGPPPAPPAGFVPPSQESRLESTQPLESEIRTEVERERKAP